jgi:hypothetical protein
VSKTKLRQSNANQYTGISVSGELYQKTVTPEISVEDLTPDSVPVLTTGGRVHYVRAVSLYENYLRTKYGRSDYYKVMLVSEAAKLAHLRGRLMKRSHEIGRFYNKAQQVVITD